MTSNLAAIAATATIVSALAACSTKHPSDFCCSTTASCAAFPGQPITTCDDPSRPFCDDTGMYGYGNTCIPDPTQMTCTDAADCTNPALPFCAGGMCVACDGDMGCSGDTPVCPMRQDSCRS